MQYVTLGHGGLKVSRLCLGSMSWGSSNTAAEGHAQIDRSLDAGLNFIDTAEMYPTYPVKPETLGDSERVIGAWFAKSGRRDNMVVATKVAGPNGGFLRDGLGYDGKVIPDTIDASLKRLQTDVIDLYHLHWPTRGSYHFRQNWTFDPSGQNRAEIETHMRDVRVALNQAVHTGKIRAWGLSNESAWGTATWLRLADETATPRPVSIQNEYSLLCRYADTDLAELCCNEEVALLPFSPLAMGLLSGKYGPDTTPAGTRRAVEATLNGRITPRVWGATDAYRAVADDHGLDVNAMALAWTLTRPFVGSSIFGVRNDGQLDVTLSAANLTLTPEILADIDIAHRAHPMPY